MQSRHSSGIDNSLLEMGRGGVMSPRPLLVSESEPRVTAFLSQYSCLSYRTSRHSSSTHACPKRHSPQLRWSSCRLSCGMNHRNSLPSWRPRRGSSRHLSSSSGRNHHSSFPGQWTSHGCSRRPSSSSEMNRRSNRNSLPCRLRRLSSSRIHRHRRKTCSNMNVFRHRSPALRSARMKRRQLRSSVRAPGPDQTVLEFSSSFLL